MSAADHVDAFRASFAQAAAAIGTTERRYAFGGRRLTTRIAGPQLAAAVDRPLIPGDGSTGPALLLDLWDATAGVPVPTLTEVDGLEERGGPAGERIAWAPGGRFVRFSGPDLALWLDRDQALVVGWVRSAESLSPWQRYRPLQTLLGPWLALGGTRIVHAAAVASATGAVVLCGSNGVGKSTSAHAAYAAGLALLGDDVVAVEPAATTVHALYAVIKLRVPPGDPRGVVEVADPHGQPEWITFLREASQRPLRSTAPIEALALPTLADVAPSRLEPISPAVALRTLLGADQAPDRATVAARLEEWAALIARVPTVRLHVGRDAGSLGEVISGLLGA